VQPFFQVDEFKAVVYSVIMLIIVLLITVGVLCPPLGVLMLIVHFCGVSHAKRNPVTYYPPDSWSAGSYEYIHRND